MSMALGVVHGMAVMERIGGVCMSDRELDLVISFVLKEVKKMMNDFDDLEQVRTAVDRWIIDLLADEYSFDEVKKRLGL